ncbi:MAG TPA: GAF domain-containing protein [Gaiellaceae bacterium]|nr:GAF domain-containing protein [Gaiellaceae bacterium]
MTLSRLKWLAIVAPLGFLAALYVLLHTVFYDLHHFPGILVLFAWAAGGVALFSFSVFALISRLERRVVEQNRRLEQRNQELAALLAVGRAAASSLELPDILGKAMDAILEVTSAEATEVWLYAEEKLRLAGHRGADSEAFAERTTLALGEGLPGLAAESGEPIIVHELTGDDRFVRSGVKRRGFESYCAFPLRHGERTVGVLGVAARDPRKLCSADELRLLGGIGERLATAIENAQLHGRVLDGAVVEERVRIARELHDGLAQVLGYINTQTLAIRKLVASGRAGEAQDKLAAMEEAARRVYSDVREAILGLRVSTAGSNGLVPTLQDYLADYGRMAGVAVELDADERAERLVLPASVEIQLVRIVQEALSNVRKHARAENARVSVRFDGGRLAVEVADDGRGFDPDAPPATGWPRFGLQTMRERAHALGATFNVVSRPGRGATVAVSVPVHAEAPSAGLAR